VLMESGDFIPAQRPVSSDGMGESYLPHFI
jgi:hypothetical protein